MRVGEVQLDRKYGARSFGPRHLEGDGHHAEGHLGRQAGNGRHAWPRRGPWLYSRLLNAQFGAHLKVISCYPGLAEVLLAVENGELDGVSGTSWYGLKSSRG